MTDTKSVLIFIALSAVLLSAISLFPESETILLTETAVTPTSNVVHVNQPSNLTLGEVTPSGWTVTVKKY